jgi:hypothetical protein
MWPKEHVYIGFISALALYIIFPQVGIIEASLIFLACIFIDTDHYLYYVVKNNDLSPIRAVKWFYAKKRRFQSLSQERKKQCFRTYKTHLLIFHGIEFVLLIAILSFFYPIFFWILIGITIHLLTDYHEMISFGLSPMIKISQIYTYIQNKPKKIDKFKTQCDYF